MDRLPQTAPVPLTTKFPSAHPLACDLLSHLLAFDPSERFTAAEALQHPYFADLPAPAAEPTPRVFPDDFSFESHRLSESDVRELIFNEILFYHPSAREMYDDASQNSANSYYAPLGGGSGSSDGLDDLGSQFARARRDDSDGRIHMVATNSGQACETAQQYPGGWPGTAVAEAAAAASGWLEPAGTATAGVDSDSSMDMDRSSGVARPSWGR